MTVKKLIENALVGNAIGVKDAFTSTMQEKVAETLKESKRELNSQFVAKMAAKDSDEA